MPSPAFVSGTTIASGIVNGDFSDIVADLNAARPLTSGGTGGTSQITGWDGLTAQGTAVPSASTIVLDTVTGPWIDISGTTTITAVTLGNGKIRLARATGAFQLTASASLIVNNSTSVNYTTTVGDFLIFTAEGGVIRVTAVGAGSLTKAAADALYVALTSIVTTAQYLANTSSKVLTTDQVWAAGALVSLTDAATITVDMSTFINATVTLGGNRTLGNPTNTKVGQSGVIYVVQDATGSRTLAYGSNYKWASGSAPTLTTTANAVDRLSYYVRSATHIDLDISKDRK